MASKLNGSVQALAQALSDVISTAVETAVEPVRDDVKRLGENVERIEKMMTGQQEHFSETLSQLNASADKIQTAANRILEARH